MTTLAAAIAFALILGTAYAALYYWMETKDPDHGLTPWAVVIGVSMVVTIYGLTIYLWTGLDAALQAITTLAALFTAAGVPMIVGYYIIRYRARPSIHLE